MSDTRHLIRFDGVGQLEQELLSMAKAVPMIMARALNRAGTAGKTAMVRAITADMGIAAKNVNRVILVDKANRSEPRLTLTISGARLPVIAFSPTGPKEPSRGKGRGISWRGPDGKRQREPHAFFATMNSGHRGVFVRQGKSRSRKGLPAHFPGLPIRELMGASIPHVAEKKMPVFEAAALDAFQKSVKHDIEFTRSKETAAA
jgi:hypothetical protein